MLKAVELDGEFSAGAIKIQNVITNHVLPPKFEPGESPSSQLTPKLLFFLRLSRRMPGDSGLRPTSPGIRPNPN